MNLPGLTWDIDSLLISPFHWVTHYKKPSSQVFSHFRALLADFRACNQSLCIDRTLCTQLSHKVMHLSHMPFLCMSQWSHLYFGGQMSRKCGLQCTHSHCNVVELFLDHCCPRMGPVEKLLFDGAAICAFPCNEFKQQTAAKGTKSPWLVRIIHKVYSLYKFGLGH